AVTRRSTRTGNVGGGGAAMAPNVPLPSLGLGHPFGNTTVRVPDAISGQVRDCLSHKAHQIPSPPQSQEINPTVTRLIACCHVMERPLGCCTRTRQAWAPRVWPRKVQNRPKKP